MDLVTHGLCERCDARAAGLGERESGVADRKDQEVCGRPWRGRQPDFSSGKHRSIWVFYQTFSFLVVENYGVHGAPRLTKRATKTAASRRVRMDGSGFRDGVSPLTPYTARAGKVKSNIEAS